MNNNKVIPSNSYGQFGSEIKEGRDIQTLWENDRYRVEQRTTGRSVKFNGESKEHRDNPFVELYLVGPHNEIQVDTNRLTGLEAKLAENPTKPRDLNVQEVSSKPGITIRYNKGEQHIGKGYTTELDITGRNVLVEYTVGKD